MADETRPADTKQKFVLLALVFSLLGAAIAAYLLKEHLAGGEMLGCSKNGTFDCESVNRSCYSEVKGIPIALWGLLGYLISAMLCARRSKVGAEEGDGSMAFAFLFAKLAVLGDVFLLWAQATQLHSYCLWCIFSYVASVGLLVTSALALGSPFLALPALRRDWDQLGSKKTLGYVLIVIIAIAFASVLMRKPPENVPLCGPWKIFNAPPGASVAVDGPSKDDALKKAREEILHARMVNPGPGGGYSRGADHPVLTLVEFGDLECPACRRFAWTMEEFAAKHPTEVRWIFRHYPLDMSCNPNVHHPIHEFACKAARATEGAGVQGKFWEYLDSVYKKNDDQGQFIPHVDFSDAALEARAKALNLNIDQWKKDSNSDAVAAKILDDAQTGGTIPVEYTPTLFINGRMIANGRDMDVLELWLDMAKKGELEEKKAP